MGKTCTLGILWILLCAASLLAPLRAAAEASFVTLSVDDTHISGDWLLPVGDLAAALAIDPDADAQVTWAQLEPRRGDIKAMVESGLSIQVAGVSVPLAFSDFQYGVRDGQPFVRAMLAADTQLPATGMDIRCAPFAATLPAHQCSVRVSWLDASVSERTLSAADGVVSLSAATAEARGFAYFFKSGVWHIWIGFDHILFLLALLIPAVYRRAGAGREPVSRMSPALVQVAAIVTAFTVTHSITLTCAAMGWIELPSRWVESIIALSVALAALHNLLPTTAGTRGIWIALAFGLLHGFGFAGVLGEQDARGVPGWTVLLGFNLGVEIGQLAIVALFFPVAYLLRNTAFYRIGVMYLGSIAIALCALAWFIDRAF